MDEHGRYHTIGFTHQEHAILNMYISDILVIQ